jgi:hypothetical protein
MIVMRWLLVMKASAVFLIALALQLPAADDGSPDEQILKAAKIGTDGPALLDYLRKRTTPRTDADKIKTLIRQLGDDSFDVREEATAELIRLSHAARQYLEEAVRDADVERARRAAACLARITSGGGVSADAAAARLLALRKPDGAAEVLLAFLPSAVNEVIAAEAQNALTALALRDGKADKTLLAGLTDKDPLKRTAAAVALCRAGAEDARPAIRDLLKDSDATVRLQVGLALVSSGEKAAVPVLIDLLSDLRRTDAWFVEDQLVRLSNGVVPAPVGTDAGTRKKCRDAWAAWWERTGDKVKLDAPAKPLGHTLLLLLDPEATTGLAREVDAQGKTLWEVKDIDFPLDAQALPGDRILLAEYRASKAIERDRKGLIVWEKPLPEGPLVAQRLANGNTFMVTERQLIEVDKDGKELWTYSRPDEDLFSKAQKMPNGDIVCIIYHLAGNRRVDQRFVRLSAERKEIQKFDLDPRTSGVCTNGGRIDVLPNGHVLVPLKDDNKVAEYDLDGKLVWEARVEQPVAAVRLPDGHTLVTTFTQKRAIELDRGGREVWEYKADARVTRAWRR